MLLRRLYKVRSLAADINEYLALPEDRRFRLWSASAPNVDNEFIARSKGKVLLDVGCGWPEARDAVRNIPCSHYIGVDFLPSNKPSVVAAIDHLSLTNNSVDSINCLSVLEHVYNPKEVIAEMFRVLKPEGVARIQVPFLLEWHGFPDDYHRYTHSALQRMFEDAGFRVLILDSDWTKGAFLNAAKILESGSWGFSKKRWRFLARVLSILLFRISASLDKYYAPGQRGIYQALVMLAEKPVESSQIASLG